VNVLGARLDQRELDARVGHRTARVLQLARGEIEPHGPCAQARQRDRPLGGAAAQLQHVEPGDVAEDVQLGLGDLPYAPGEAGPLGQLIPVALLVRVRLALPVRAVLGDVVRDWRQG
jgi:hypothetical protein